MKKIRFNVLEREKMLNSHEMKNLMGGSYGCWACGCGGNRTNETCGSSYSWVVAMVMDRCPDGGGCDA